MSSGKAKRILVTGGAGFVGSHLCERLLSETHEVTEEGLNNTIAYFERALGRKSMTPHLEEIAA